MLGIIIIFYIYDIYNLYNRYNNYGIYGNYYNRARVQLHSPVIIIIKVYLFFKINII